MSRVFCLQKSFLRGPFWFFSKNVGTEELCVTGVSRLLDHFFLSHNTKKNRRGTLLFIWKFLVWKRFVHKKGCHNFPSKILCLTVAKIFVERTFWCLRVLACACMYCSCMLLNIVLSKRNWEMIIGKNKTNDTKKIST